MEFACIFSWFFPRFLFRGRFYRGFACLEATETKSLVGRAGANKRTVEGDWELETVILFTRWAGTQAFLVIEYCAFLLEGWHKLVLGRGV